MADNEFVSTLVSRNQTLYREYVHKDDIPVVYAATGRADATAALISKFFGITTHMAVFKRMIYNDKEDPLGKSYYCLIARAYWGAGAEENVTRGTFVAEVKRYLIASKSTNWQGFRVWIFCHVAGNYVDITANDKMLWELKSAWSESVAEWVADSVDYSDAPETKKVQNEVKDQGSESEDDLDPEDSE